MVLSSASTGGRILVAALVHATNGAAPIGQSSSGCGSIGAENEPAIRIVHLDGETFRALARPRGDLALPYGFTEVGEQWDDEDGLEIIYEKRA